jgi:hypothetical protein
MQHSFYEVIFNVYFRNCVQTSKVQNSSSLYSIVLSSRHLPISSPQSILVVEFLLFDPHTTSSPFMAFFLLPVKQRCVIVTTVFVIGLELIVDFSDFVLGKLVGSRHIGEHRQNFSVLSLMSTVVPPFVVLQWIIASEDDVDLRQAFWCGFLFVTCGRPPFSS